jgi:hypothetical protein
MPLKVARILAAMAVAACAIGTARAAVVIRTNTGGPPDVLFLWTIAPFLFAATVLLSVGRRSFGAVWVPIGAMLGFVVLASWSLGLFFGWAALLLLGSGAAHVAAVRAGRMAFLIPVWALIGASGMCAVFFAYHQLMVAWLGGGQIIEAPLIEIGAEVFVALSALVVLASAVRSRLLKSASS